MKADTEEIKELHDEIDVLTKKISDFESNEKMFHALVETAVGKIGEDFFNTIVKKLSEWLNAECVIIGQLIGDNIAQGFPMYLDGKIIHGFTYSLKDTPCDLTSKKGFCIYSDDVRSVFPTAKDLIDLNARGYVGTALYNEDGKANGILCAISRNPLHLPPQAEDIMRIVGARITAEIERTKTQKALELSENKLRKAVATKDKFFSIIAHDLKAPFNSLIGYSQVLLKNIEKKDFTRTEKHVKVIHDTASHTLNLLNNLLEWSLTQTGKIKYSPEKITVKGLFDETLEYFGGLCVYKKLDITYKADPLLVMYADRHMIHTILRNFVSNAIKYTKDEGKISISGMLKDQEVIIAVEDTGIGIEPKVLSKLFNLDETISTAGTHNEKGTGLGLILCKEFIDKHNGRIWAESKVGKGSIFYFAIPAKSH